jgi:hypothetical protein
MTATIPLGWIPKDNTLITLFLWNLFTASSGSNPFTQQYYTYQLTVEATTGPEVYFAGTSLTRPYLNQGQNQYFPIVGNILQPLAAGNRIVFRFYGKLAGGSPNNMTNQDEQVTGAITTGY